MKRIETKVNRRGIATNGGRAGSAGRREGRSLRREITVALALKFIAILIIWIVFFRPDLRPPIDAGVVDRALFAPPSPVEQGSPTDD